MFGPETFIVQIADDAMAPRVCAGDYIWIDPWIDPGEPAVDGRLVAVHDPDRGGETVALSMGRFTGPGPPGSTNHCAAAAVCRPQAGRISSNAPESGRRTGRAVERPIPPRRAQRRSASCQRVAQTAVRS